LEESKRASALNQLDSPLFLNYRNCCLESYSGESFILHTVLLLWNDSSVKYKDTSTIETNVLEDGHL
jgi:hypothetical protein